MLIIIAFYLLPAIEFFNYQSPRIEPAEEPIRVKKGTGPWPDMNTDGVYEKRAPWERHPLSVFDTSNP